MNIAVQCIAQPLLRSGAKKANDAGRCGAATLLLLFHRRAAAFNGAGAAFGDDYLRRTFATDINFAKLISH